MRQEGGIFGSWFMASGPRMANATLVPSAEVSTSFTSQLAPAVRRAVMLVSVALGEAVARMKRSADGTASRSTRRSSCCTTPAAFFGTVCFT